MRKDPLTTFLFALKIDKLGISEQTAFFKSCSGLNIETEVVDYQEGGITEFTRKLQGVTKWPNITLKQGFSGDAKLLDWKVKKFRVNGSIIILGPNMQPKGTWSFKNGWPAKWVGPELDASKNELAIESIEIAHEGWDFSG
jgi:phage tail-like protein